MSIPNKNQLLKFTVGMAVYDRKVTECASPESQQVVFTVMSLLVHHMPFVNEVVIVDNNPQPGSVLPTWAAGLGGMVRYVPMPEPQGTMPPKNRVVEEARSEHVVVIDSHVLLYPGFFKYLSDFYNEHGHDCKDLLHGPIMTELGGFVGHHLNDQWRGQMWGTWGKAWVTPQGMHFSCVEDP